MSTIQIKRGQSANIAKTTLGAGEPAFTLDTGKLYVGNGVDKVLINPDQANAETADKLKIARTISITGDVTGTVSFDGSSNVSIAATYKNSGVTAGTYTKVTTDSKGNVTAGGNLTTGDIPNLTLAKITDSGTAASKNVGTSAGQIPILDATGKIPASILPSITGAVSSVAGKTGVVTLTPSDVGLGNVTNESKSTMFANATLTGAPTAPTPTTTDSSTKIATTAFVKAQGYMSNSDVIDGGTF